LQEKLTSAVTKILKGQLPASRFEKCFSLFVLTQAKSNNSFRTFPRAQPVHAGNSNAQPKSDDDFHNESQELYLHRNEGSDEDRALLAIGLHQQNIMAREQQQLLREIDKPIKERAFNPATFTSMTRTEAMRAFAFNIIAPPMWTKQRK